MKTLLLGLMLIGSMSSFALERTCRGTSSSAIRIQGGPAYTLNVCCKENLEGFNKCLTKTVSSYGESKRLSSLLTGGDGKIMRVNVSAAQDDFSILEGETIDEKISFYKSFLKVDCGVNVTKMTRFIRERGTIIKRIVTENDLSSIVTNDQMLSFLTSLYEGLGNCREKVDESGMLYVRLRKENSNRADVGYSFFGAD